MARENVPRAKAADAIARDVYRQAQEQAAQAADYDVQAGLERLSSWMEETSADASGERAVASSQASRPRNKLGLVASVVEGESGNSEGTGHQASTACRAAGITYRQLDYWVRTGLVEPSIRAEQEPGSRQLYGFRDILILKVVKRLLDTGISLQQIRAAVRDMQDRDTANLAQVTLMSDGVSVYECTSPDEVVDLLAGGRGVFAIALGRVWQETAGELTGPPIREEDGLIIQHPLGSDEAYRRAGGIA